MLSPIENNRMTSCRTPSNTPHRLKRMISFRNRNTGLVSPSMRYSLSPKTRTKSASTWSLDTSTPVTSNKSVKLNRTKNTPKPEISRNNRFSTPVSINKSSCIRMKSPSTYVGANKHNLSFSTPSGSNKSKNTNRSQSSLTESTDETESFLMISMSEI